jgi:cell shape-determining protein MreC
MSAVSTFVAMVLGLFALVAGAYAAGRKTSKVKQENADLKEEVKEAEQLVEEIKIVNEVKNEVAAMDDTELRDAGYKWVRNRPKDGRP